MRARGYYTFKQSRGITHFGNLQISFLYATYRPRDISFSLTYISSSERTHTNAVRIDSLNTYVIQIYISISVAPVTRSVEIYHDTVTDKRREVEVLGYIIILIRKICEDLRAIGVAIECIEYLKVTTSRVLIIERQAHSIGAIKHNRRRSQIVVGSS